MKKLRDIPYCATSPTVMLLSHFPYRHVIDFFRGRRRRFS
jgi:hypothetical protein